MFLITLSLLLVTAPPDAPAYAIRLDDALPRTFAVHGLAPADAARLARLDWTAEQWAALFAVYVDNDTPVKKDLPPVLGTYRVEQGVLRFAPRFPPVPGVRYRAVFDPSRLPGAGGGKSVEAVFLLPKPPTVATTVVTQVYPTSDRLPENQLKFYLHFSAPMSRGEAYEHVRLLGADGKEIERAFLELDQELWDRGCRRFTLFIDPGRIKRGLKPREDLGPVLEHGKRYTLVIDRGWSDAAGNPLKTGYRKSFQAGAERDQPVEPKQWQLTPPGAGSRKPLEVRFPAPLDHALLHRALWVVDAVGHRVEGDIVVRDAETVWQLTPDAAWPAGTYHLVVDTTLEDLAGNRVGRSFEVDVFRQVQKQIKLETVRVAFHVGK